MSWFTSIRDAVEAVASVGANYVYPGSGLITSQLVSKGAQNLPGYQMAMLGSGAAGGLMGNMSNYGNAFSTSAPSWYSGEGGGVTSGGALTGSEATANSTNDPLGSLIDQNK